MKKKGMTGVLQTDHGQRPEEKAEKVGFGQTKAPTGTLIKTASQAVATLPVGGRRLGEVVSSKAGNWEKNASEEKG